MSNYGKDIVDVSIVIVNYNTAELTMQCIASIRMKVREIRYEIIVVDNNSADRSVDLLEKEIDVQVIRNTENIGFGRANNQGAQAAKGTYLFFVNSDTYFLNDAAGILFDFMESKKNDDVACCGGMLLTPDGNPQASYGNFPSLWGTIAQVGFYRFFRKHFFDKMTIAVSDSGKETKEVDYISGADLFVRADLFRKIGGFDPDFFLYFEETELAWRFRKAGFKSIWLPEAEMVHLESGGHIAEGRWPLRKVKMFAKSRQLYFRKTTGRWGAALVKTMLAVHALAQCVYHRQKYYFEVFRIIVAS